MRDDDGADLRETVNQPDAANDIALIAAGYPATAGIAIVAVDGIDDVADAEPEVLQLFRIKIKLVLGGEAAEIRVIDDAGNGFQGRYDDPSLDLG